MKVSRIELNNFKRFTHLIIEEIPETTRLVVLVGPNGSGKSSLLEAMNQYHKYSGHGQLGDSGYLSKLTRKFQQNEWYQEAGKEIRITFHDIDLSNAFGRSESKGRFYFRGAYRNEPEFVIGSFSSQPNPVDSIRLDKLIQNDQTVSSNYQRLVSKMIGEVFDVKNNQKSVLDIRNELVSRINEGMKGVFSDLQLTSLGNPLVDGGFYYTKGVVENYDYRNLSAGEKATFDLLLDLVIHSEYYPDAIYAIDEPEAHLHTAIQPFVLREIYKLIPEKSQLWISTHSIGMLQEAEAIEKRSPGSVAFLDFGGRDFDEEQVLCPTKIGRSIVSRFYDLAFGDYSRLILPKVIVVCEGSSKGERRKDFDKCVFETIFGEKHHDTLFYSGGSSSEVESFPSTTGDIVEAILRYTKIIRIVDRDDKSEEEVHRLIEKGVRVLSRRMIESYLLDDEVIKKLCTMTDSSEKIDECIRKKQEAINNSIERGNSPDDLKRASGGIYIAIKRELSLERAGSNADAFMRDTLAPLITEDMDVYKLLEKDIFGE